MKTVFLSLLLFLALVVLVKAQDCTGVAPWTASASYATTNTKVVKAGVLYHSNFWTSNQDPATNNEGAGSGQPWTLEGTCLTVPTGQVQQEPHLSIGR